jgi:hypothetical protein
MIMNLSYSTTVVVDLQAHFTELECPVFLFFIMSNFLSNKSDLISNVLMESKSREVTVHARANPLIAQRICTGTSLLSRVLPVAITFSWPSICMFRRCRMSSISCTLVCVRARASVGPGTHTNSCSSAPDGTRCLRFELSSEQLAHWGGDTNVAFQTSAICGAKETISAFDRGHEY